MLRSHAARAFAVLLLGLLSLPVLAQQANAPADLPSVLALLSDKDPIVRDQAAIDVTAFGLPALAPLFALVDTGEGPETVAARHALESLCYKAGGTAEADAWANALLAQAYVLKRPMVRQEALRFLSLVALPAQASAVAKLAYDPELFDMSIYVLTRIPGGESTQALSGIARDMLTAANEGKTVAAVLGLAQKHDAGSLPTLREALKSDSLTVRLAAIKAVGDTPNKEGAPLLREWMHCECPASAQAATEAFIALAERLRTGPNRYSAKDLFEELYTVGHAQETTLCAALRGLGKCGGAGVLETLLAELGHNAPAVRAVAREALAGLDVPNVSGAVASAMAGQSAAFRIEALQVLGARGDETGVPAMVAATTDADAAVRLAAYRALADAKARSGAVALVAAARAASGAERDSALWALSRIGGGQAVDAILAALGDPALEAPLRVALLKSLGVRGDARATSALLAGVGSDVADVRKAALGALGALGDAKAIEPLLGALGNLPKEDAPSAIAAIARVPASAGKPILLGQLDKANPTAQAVILGVLGGYGDKSLADLFRQWAASDEALVAAAAIGALSSVAGDEALADLRPYADDGRPEVRAAAVNGMLASAEARIAQDAGALAIYQEALRQAPDDAVKSRALNGIARVPDASSLPLIEPLLGNPGGTGPALASALVAVSGKVASSDPQKAVGLLTKAISLARDPALVRQVAKTLRDLGVDVDVAKEGGFITGWWITGPAGSREDLRKGDLLDPAKPIDVTKPVGSAAWKWAFVDDPNGLTDLEVLSARQDNVGCYLYAEVESPSAQDVTLRVGSDDDIVLWLNGKQIHQYIADRGLTLDGDVIAAKLDKGTNRILAKVLNGGGQWSCAVRLVGADGKPLVLPQARPKILRPEDAGFVTRWWLAGPWAGRVRMSTVEALDPKLAVDTARGVSYGGRTNQWKFLRTEAENAMLDLRALVADQNDACCYAVAKIVSDGDQDAVLKLGSDDDVVVWLNGREVHRNASARPCEVDQDSVPVHLVKGENTLLVKVLQGEGQWALVARLTKADGSPLVLRQLGP